MNINQKNLWENIYTNYKYHYFDYWSNKYKQRFIFNEILSFTNFNNKNVLEICCGSGENALFFLGKSVNCKIYGIDISKNAVDDFKSCVGADAYEFDIQNEISSLDNCFDIIYVLGGMHHCTKNINGVLSNIHRMLKPNGLFIMHEPNSSFFLEPIRRLWYSKDPLFDNDSENALNHDDLIKIGSSYGFEISSLKYIGGPGFFIILQSMVLRIPKIIKYVISPFFYFMEIIWNFQNLPLLNNTFLSCWRKVR